MGFQKRFQNEKVWYKCHRSRYCYCYYSATKECLDALLCYSIHNFRSSSKNIHLLLPPLRRLPRSPIGSTFLVVECLGIVTGVAPVRLEKALPSMQDHASTPALHSVGVVEGGGLKSGARNWKLYYLSPKSNYNKKPES